MAAHCIAALVALTLLVGGCATTNNALDDRRPAALLLTTDNYELHYRDGRVVLLDQRPEATPSPREVETYEEFKQLYEVRKETALPDRLPSDGVAVDGYQGLDCVRKGATCGRATERPTPGAPIRLKLFFPQSAQ